MLFIRVILISACTCICINNNDMMYEQVTVYCNYRKPVVIFEFQELVLQDAQGEPMIINEHYVVQTKIKAS